MKKYQEYICVLKLYLRKRSDMLKSHSKFFTLALIIFLSSCSASRKARIERRNMVVSTAKSYIGVPYRYGGTNRGGMDCSGLLLKSFQSVDYQLPRTSKEQSKVGKKIPIEELRKGDMVFFSAKPRKRKITHAGIVSLKKKDVILFIHASTSKGVIEADLLSDYYRKRFVRARRIKF